MRRRKGLPPWLVIAGAELVMLRRNPLALVTAVLFPFVLGLILIWLAQSTGKGGYAGAAVFQLVTLLTMTPYVAGTTILAARRQQFVLKRLRASRASALGVVAGTLAPLGLLLLVQAVVLFAVVAVVGGQTPARVALLALAATLGAVAACALAVVTAAVTPAPELAQLTTAPIGLAFFGGGPWAMQRPLDDVGWAMLAAPGVPVAQLTRLGWDEVATATVLRVGAPSVVALLALAVLSTALAVRVFRWDPRA